jgi:flagellar assembly protein FliH
LRDELNRELQERAAVAEEEGRRRGYEAGIVRGQQEGLRAFEEGAAKIDGVLRAVHDRFVAEISGVEDTLVSIVFEAVCRILGDTLVKPESVRAVVRQVLARVRDQERIVVRVAPADYELLTHATRLLRLQNGARRRVELVADDRVILGGCLIETDGGNLDARLEMQVQQLRDVLLAARQAPPE